MKHLRTLFVLSCALFTWTTAASADEQWVQSYNGARSMNDQAQVVGVDKLGNVYVAGSSYEGTANPATTDITIIKYDASGEEQWEVHYDGIGHLDDYPYAIALDGAGNVYVAGA